MLGGFFPPEIFICIWKWITSIFAVPLAWTLVWQFCTDKHRTQTSGGVVSVPPFMGLGNCWCLHAMALFLSPSTCPWRALWISYWSQPCLAADEKPVVSEPAAPQTSLVPRASVSLFKMKISWSRCWKWTTWQNGPIHQHNTEYCPRAKRH